MAESGGGKEHARQCITAAFVAAGLTKYIGGSHLASGSGLLSALARQPSMIFQLDEFGAFLKKAINPRAPKHVAEIWDFLTELATSAGTVFLGAEYADQKEHPRQDIIEPCCVVHATTVPEPFWQALNPGFLRDGSFARWLVFNSDDPLPDFVTTPADLKAVPADLIDGLQAISGGAGSPGTGGNLAGLAIGTPQPYTVPYDAPAAAALDELAHDMTSTSGPSGNRAVGLAGAGLGACRTGRDDPRDLAGSDPARWSGLASVQMGRGDRRLLRRHDDQGIQPERLGQRAGDADQAGTEHHPQSRGEGDITPRLDQGNLVSRQRSPARRGAERAAQR